MEYNRTGKLLRGKSVYKTTLFPFSTLEWNCMRHKSSNDAKSNCGCLNESIPISFVVCLFVCLLCVVVVFLSILLLLYINIKK